MNYNKEKCNICPRECGADRTRKNGFCGCPDVMLVNKVMLHRWEEPCISGADENRGSGAVFFSGCNLKCVFCQNRDISRGAEGEEFAPARLAEEMKKLEASGAYNINFVTPTHYYPQIIEALRIYRPRVPVISNTGGYEKAETVKALSGYFDIFLTDFKYGDDNLAKEYSKAPDYTSVALSALSEMVKITGRPEYGEDGMMKKGVIVRHLVLPGARKSSLEALKLVAETVGAENVVLSLMSQYTPDFAPNISPLNRRITTFEYESVRDAALSLGFNGYSQDASSAKKSYTPDFNNKE